MLVLGILRLAARLESPVALLRRAGAGTIETTPEGLVTLLSAIAARQAEAVFVSSGISLIGLGFIWGLLRWTTAGEAIVGADGITLNRLFQKRFVPHAEIESVAQTSYGVRVTTRGQPLDLPMKTFVSDRSQSSAALITRIDEAREASHRSFDVAALELLDRRGRTVSAWREALARITHRSGDYRSSVLESADLAHVIEDASAPPERRIGAALALASLPGDPELKQRVRVAAQASANAPVRIALEKALSGKLDDGDLEDDAALAAAPLRAGMQRS